MILIPQCPDTLELEALLDGELSDQLATELQDHIESCDDCQRRVDGLDAGDDSLGRLREHLKVPSEAIDTTLHVAMKEIKSISLSSDLHHLNNKLETSLDFLSSSNEPDSVGRLGRYEISEVVGRGGMGIVLKGYDPQLKRIVAIKVLAPELASNANARKRFRREGQAAAAVIDDHVVTIHGVDEANGLPHLVMEYISGRSLQDRIDRDGPLELKEILRIGMQAASGLAAAHAQGLVHRDIKPANILLENSVERVKITDFGLARAVDDVRITRQGVVTGTPEYMSPEQARSERVDHRSDLFSLGCVLYAMCTGRPPFRAESTVAMIRRVCDDEPRRLQEVNSEIPDPLANFVVKLLAKNPDERFQSAAEVSVLLGRYLAHIQQPEANPSPPVIADMPTNAANSRASKFRRNWLTVAAVLLALLTSFGIMEASGVTSFASTVIRLVQGEGIVVIEIDDPEVKVAIDGDDLIITGPGIKEFRLPTGQHELTAHKAGGIIRRELVSITRGGKQLVRISQEPAARPNEELTGQKRRLVWSTGNRQIGVSPDGRYISFVDWENTFDLAIRDLATGEERRVTNEGSRDRDSVEFAYWSKPSPDGRQIAYSWGLEGHEARQLRVVDIDTGDYRLLFDNPDGAYVVPMGWSQDGQYIAAALRPTVATVWQIELFSTKDGSHRLLKSLDWRFPEGTNFSPDGRYIVYAAKLDQDSPNSDIFLLATDGSREVTLVEHPAVDSQPLWTPDGRGIVFLSDRGGSKSLWYLEMADAQPQGDPTLLADNVDADSSIGFTSDGAYYFLKNRHGFRLSGDVYVATLDPAGSAIEGPPRKTILQSEGGNTLASWSTDGNYLAYTRRATDVSLVLRNMTSGEERELHPRARWWVGPRDCLPRWSPDGKTILVSRNGLHSIDVQSGDIVPLVQDEGVQRFVYSPDGTVVYYLRQLRSSGSVEAIEVVSRELATQNVKVLSQHDSNDGQDYGLAISPDGQQLAVASLRRIWLMPIEGGTSRQLLSLPEDEVIPEHVGIAWTPLGNSLIFAKRLLGPKERYSLKAPAKRSELWKVAVDSGAAESLNLVVDGLRQLSLHPDGRQITYTQYPPGADPRTEIWAIDDFLPRLAAQQ